MTKTSNGNTTAPDACLPWPGADVTQLSEIERCGDHEFASRYAIIPETRRIFGGQVLGQALAAAEACVPEKYAAHAIHALFLSAGDASRQVRYFVEEMRQGRSFASRRVRAMQDDLILLEMMVSCHIDETGGINHQSSMPEGIPDPDTLETFEEYADRTENVVARTFVNRFPAFVALDIRPCGPLGVVPGEESRRRFWIRLRPQLALDDACVKRSLLAYLSDVWLAGASLAKHHQALGSVYPQMVSLDHSFWIHHTADPCDWLLFDTDSPFAGNQTGLSRGTLFDRSGRLVANIAQQALIRT
ncbi:acyl-CoA thioesterase [Novosphingobium malaysiense]|uniref:acyl-CoA thioesterase n=1 Tax=Novosphingobium malaysiense TaxID=1348853 RepID=UPI00068B8806|nr:acyl-CoA thioesterase domain-containing protein [Novosphingobium malaysiense]